LDRDNSGRRAEYALQQYGAPTSACQSAEATLVAAVKMASSFWQFVFKFLFLVSSCEGRTFV
jgi:hypothetical protein